MSDKEVQLCKNVILACIVLLAVHPIGSELFAQPTINNVTIDPNPVGRYEKTELTVDLTASYANPFDPEDVDLWAVFTSPSSVDWHVNGFWDGAHWKIRFAARDTGSWSYTVYVDDGTGQDSTNPGYFTCQTSAQHGWLRISTADPRYLQHDDGASFLGIGQCRCWDLGAVPDIFTDMQAHGMNMLVYWMPSWDNMLVTLDTGYDFYDMHHAASIDTVVEKCEQHDIYLVLTIWNHDELRGAGHPWPRKYFDDFNPFHDLTDATGFMSDSTSWAYQEKLYRYIIARWGYSRAIGLWCTICEIDGTTNSYNNDAATDPWHSQINSYFKSHDPFGHPITASKSDSSTWNWSTGFGVMDCPQAHVYQDGVEISNTIATRTRSMREAHEKPSFIGEFGAQWGTTPTTQHLHDGIWAGLAAGGAIAPLDWNDGGDWGDLTPEMYDQGKYLADFVFGLTFDQLDLEPCSLSVAEELEAWGMLGNELGFLWVQDTSPGEINSGATIALLGLPLGQWSFDWYDAWTGKYLPDPRVESTFDGPITVTIPDFTNDVACRLAEVGEIGQNVVHLRPVGDVTTWPDTPYRWKDIADHVYAQAYQDSFSYDQPRVMVAYNLYDSTFIGRLTAFGLKPNFAYQMKLVGKPIKQWGDDGCDQSNEYIGYEGRWWREQPNPGNTDDADYEAHKDDSTYIFVGYLLFDYFATDEYGMAKKEFALESSYHVLWNTVLNSRPPGPNDSSISTHWVTAWGYNPAYDTTLTPGEVGLYAEWEPGRDLPGEVVLPAWMYNVQLILTEESFHQSGLGGYWAGAMGCDTVFFSIPGSVEAPTVTSISPAVSASQIRLQWTSIGDARYNIYRDTNPNFIPGTPLAKDLADPHYTDVDPGIVGDADVNYYYAVTAVVGGVESSPSGRMGEFDIEMLSE